MFFVSGSMGATFANIAHQMTERIRELGPNPLKSSPEKTDKVESLQSE
jgi:coenzyme F420-reducing hydrogenase delta subunit